MNDVKFKQGDRVRYTGNSLVFRELGRIGSAGEVRDTSGGVVSVRWDDGYPGGNVYLGNLELIEPPAPEPTVQIHRTFSYVHPDLATVLQHAALDVAGMEIVDPGEVYISVSRYKDSYELEVQV